MILADTDISSKIKFFIKFEALVSGHSLSALGTPKSISFNLMCLVKLPNRVFIQSIHIHHTAPPS